MQHNNRNNAYLWDMLRAAKDIVEFIKNMSFEQFVADKKTRFAVERQLLVIGEAANHISESFRSEHPEVPWRRIIGQRNVLAHEYGEVLVERIWLAAQNNLPALIEDLNKLIPDTDV